MHHSTVTKPLANFLGVAGVFDFFQREKNDYLVSELIEDNGAAPVSGRRRSA